MAAWQLRDGQLSIVDGLVLLALLVVVLGIQIVLSVREGSSHKVDDIDDSKIVEHHAVDDALSTADSEPSLLRGLWALFLGLTMLVASSRAIVWGAVELATLWGLSELIIGLTIVAVGTSLPELVASLSAARKGEHDMALGNIIGSNIFNTLGVVGLAAVIAPISASQIILSRDVLAMSAITLLLVVLCGAAFIRHRPFGRGSGAALMLFFVGYTLWLMQTVNM